MLVVGLVSGPIATAFAVFEILCRPPVSRGVEPGRASGGAVDLLVVFSADAQHAACGAVPPPGERTAGLGVARVLPFDGREDLEPGMAVTPQPGGMRTGAGWDEGGLLGIYLAEIGRHPLLTAADEKRLGQAIEAGREATERLEHDATLSPACRRELEAAVSAGRSAARTLVQANLRLVVSIARRHAHLGLSLLDLVQEGNIGLMRAVERFDHRRELRFSTYATWLIRQAIIRAAANTGRLVRLPVRVGEVVARTRATQARLEGELGRRPTAAELGRELGMSSDRVREVLGHGRDPVSISQSVREDGQLEVGDVIEAAPAASPFDQVAATLLREDLARLLGTLDALERAVVVLRYGLDGSEPRTVAEVARRLTLTPETGRNLHLRALRKLRLLGQEIEGAHELLAG
ncbi:MAG: sigma-70 family RNA polymerase sigma factor [Actinomycetota bacterium]|nr:sigma-70 family RNA polymerase sigma factor [Actinomycetota bacterium]